MTAYRRLGWNYSLQHAVDLARSYGKPLVILEILKADYPYASPRLHAFLLDGMRERSRKLQGGPVLHYPFVESESGEGDGLIQALGARACHVVTDDFPSFFLPKMIASEGRRLDVRLDLVDSNGLLPLRASDRVFTAAYHFRRFLQKTLPEHLGAAPDPAPLATPPPSAPPSLGRPLTERWRPAELATGKELRDLLKALPLDLSVPATDLPGGSVHARKRLDRFVEGALDRYLEDRNHPDRHATSGLSPYLHFGDVSAHEVFSRVTGWEDWTPARISGKTDGSRSGWWGMGSSAEAFLDQLVTWRELGFNMSSRRADYARYESLPEWARETLREHEGDPRPHLYSYDQLRDAETHDPLWNAAQRQLRREGVIHNYLRMLWGKKILEWTPSARDALEIMLDLNDRLALDGRDPNSYSGIFWCLGRYDRGWQERPVFGKIRYMSSPRTRKKVELEEYLRSFGDEGQAERES